MTRTRAIQIALATACFGLTAILVLRLLDAKRDVPLVYYYDLSAERLFVRERSDIPVVGIDGSERDGVRAIVFTCGGSCDDSSSRRIAYLEMTTQILIDRIDAIQRGEALPFERGDPFVNENKLVRRVDGEWHSMLTEQAADIVSSWRRTCPDGSQARICLP